MIMLLCALSSNRDFAGFSTHKQEKNTCHTHYHSLGSDFVSDV